MPNRDREIVEQYQRMFATPHTKAVPGQWYLIYHPVYKETYVHLVDDNGKIFWEDHEHGDVTLDSYRETGWEVTPVMIYTVDTSKVR